MNSLAGAVRQWVRRGRQALPRCAGFGDVLIVGYREVRPGAELATGAPGNVSLRTFLRQIAWLRQAYELAPIGSLSRGRERWSDRRPRALVVFEGPHPSALEHAVPRLRKLGIPSAVLVRGDVGAPWEELKSWRDDPLVEVHAAVARDDWRGVSPAAALADMLAATAAIEERLGLASDVVVAPPGFLPDPGWLTALESAEQLQRYRAVLWTTSAVNPYGFLRARTRHWACWSAPARFGLPERLAWWFPPRITRYHTDERRLTVREAPHATFTDRPSRAQFRAILTVLHPFKSHHHSPEHLAYLYDVNRFLPAGVPVHYALVYDGRVEAVAAAVGTPVREAGRVAPAIGFSTWYRLPVVHHPHGARPLAEAYLAHPCTMLNYDTSVFAWAALQTAGWIRFPATQFAGPVDRAVRALEPTAGRLVEADAPAAVAPALRRCWEALAARFDCAVDRTPEYWDWKFGRNPMAPYRFYAWLDGAEPVAVCALGWEGERILLADLVYAPHRPALARELQTFLARALGQATRLNPVRSVIAETNQAAVAEAFRGLRLRPVRETFLDWRPSPSSALGPTPTAYRSLIDADFGVRPAL